MWNSQMIKAGTVIFDLDGCVADDRLRRQHLPKRHDGVEPGFAVTNESYDEYHKGQANDPIFKFSLDAILAAHNSGHSIVFLTARPITYQSVTLEWLRNNIVAKYRDIQYCLVMRGEGDLRGSVEYKRSWVSQMLGSGAVLAAFDDRADIVAMYREYGLPAWVLDHAGIDVDDPKAEELPKWLLGGLVKINREVKADGPTQPAKEIACQANGKPVESPSDAGDILMSMGETFKERNALYKDNAVLVGKIMEVMFPDGVTLKTPEDFHMWHLFELKIVKLTRFVKSGLTHADSIHDDAIYSAMCERLVNSHSIKVN